MLSEYYYRKGLEHFLIGLNRTQVSADAGKSLRVTDWICRKMFGGRGRDRTGDPLLAKSSSRHDLVSLFNFVLRDDARF
jgi:hypothetical protein